MGLISELVDLGVYHVLQRRSVAAMRRGHPQVAVFAFDDIGHRINLKGRYELEELEAFFAWADAQGIDFADGVAVDAGAFIGNHSLFFAPRFTHVYSFEPNPSSFALLQYNASLAGNVTPFGIGLSDAEATLAFQVNPHNIGASPITETGEQRIKVTSLDRALPDDVGPIKLIKIDVEGHEWRALGGARETIKRHRPIIIFEQGYLDFTLGEGRVIARLQDYGYSRFAVVVSPHSRIRNRYLRALLTLGRRARIEEVAQVEPANYAMIIAIPEWM